MTIRTSAQLGSAIRARRKELGITQKDLALSCGTGLRFIIDLEKGKSTCHLGKALHVLQAVGLAMDLVPAGGEKAGDRP